MATRLNKPVKRVVELGERRPIVVSIDPNGSMPLMWFREYGRRTAYALPLVWCYKQAAMKAGQALYAERAARRRRAK